MGEIARVGTKKNTFLEISSKLYLDHCEEHRCTSNRNIRSFDAHWPKDTQRGAQNIRCRVSTSDLPAHGCKPAGGTWMDMETLSATIQ